MTSDRNIDTFTIDWQGMSLSITFEADWLNMGARHNYGTAHLQIQAIKPEKATLPITETGYRSHFLQADEVIDAGGPVAYVLAWLDHAAKSRKWCEQQRQMRERELADRQLSLF